MALTFMPVLCCLQCLLLLHLLIWIQKILGRFLLNGSIEVYVDCNLEEGEFFVKMTHDDTLKSLWGKFEGIEEGFCCDFHIKRQTSGSIKGTLKCFWQELTLNEMFMVSEPSYFETSTKSSLTWERAKLWWRESFRDVSSLRWLSRRWSLLFVFTKILGKNGYKRETLFSLVSPRLSMEHPRPKSGQKVSTFPLILFSFQTPGTLGKE